MIPNMQHRCHDYNYIRAAIYSFLFSKVNLMVELPTTNLLQGNELMRDESVMMLMWVDQIL
jgi:hypothetical protein